MLQDTTLHQDSRYARPQIPQEEIIVLQVASKASALGMKQHLSALKPVHHLGFNRLNQAKAQGPLLRQLSSKRYRYSVPYPPSDKTRRISWQQSSFPGRLSKRSR